MNAQPSPLCGLCRQPRRWIEKRQAFALYCNGSNCGATERPCKSCGELFAVGDEGTKSRECASCARREPGTEAFEPPKWSGRIVKRAREHVATSLPAPCGKCGDVVDGSEPWVVGHVASRSMHPELTLDPDNWQVEHRSCSDKSGAFAVREIAYRDGFTDGWASATRHLATEVSR